MWNDSILKDWEYRGGNVPFQSIEKTFLIQKTLVLRLIIKALGNRQKSA